MITISPLGSSSAGNAYHITDGETALLLEAGIPFPTIRRRLNYQVSAIAGCLITHDHGDHIRSAKALMGAGVDVYCTRGTAAAAGLSGHRLNTIKAGTSFTVGSWAVMPFEVQHDSDGGEPVGFLLANRAGDKLLFATDTYYIRYRFSGITHLMIECNYSREIVMRNIDQAEDDAKRSDLMARYKRIFKAHFSLENVKEFIRENDMSCLREVWLLHLSDANSDEATFKREIQELTGRPVYVAEK